MTRELPSGVVTLLFTDVEGSTKLLHELGADAYGEALNEHRRALRACFEEHDGVEVDTQGDSFFVAFARATDAVAAATDGQRALAHGPIKVRIGLHSGEVQQTDEGYVGLEVHRGARIAAVGHGGQVLLSATTQALSEARTRDLGSHRLKDITTPERIFQLEIDGLPSDFPLLKTLEAGITNLPAPRTSFVGRTRELVEIEQLLEDPECRLLTLVGPGGAGKTRLALEAAARRVDRYPHGVHFVSLAPVASPELLAPAVADSLQFSVDAAHSGTPARDQLLDFLAERSTLLVLDNFEHLIEGAELLSQVVQRSPKVEILTTSRERLNVQSEWVLDVAGLDGEGGALQLFVERARQLDSGFELDDDEREQAARICRLVDGMPLGIELAASWTAMLSCAEIADEIQRGLDLLETSARDVPERHRSLRAAFDQSWRLLTDTEREAFARISVFRGGFTREAAETVVGAGLPLLASLAAKSLVRRQGLGRFDQHELVRQYGSERREELADEPRRSGERHARFYLGRLADRRDQLLGTDMAVARDELRVDVDNMIAAAEWALTKWDVEEARSALRDLRLFYFNHGEFEGGTAFVHLAESVVGQDWASLDPAEAEPFQRLIVMHAAAQGNAAGYTEVGERVARAYLPMLREHGTPSELVECLLTLGILDCYQDDYPASAAELSEAVAVGRELGDDLAMSIGLSWLGFTLLLLDDLGGARDAFEEELAIGRRVGNPLLHAYALSKLGILADAEENFERAMRLHMEATELFESVGDVGGTGYTLSRSSLSAYGLGDYEEAMRFGRAGYEAFDAVNHRWGSTAALTRIGFAAAALGDTEEARTNLERALELARAIKAVSLELLALSGLGVVLSLEGEKRLAAEVLIFTLNHPYLPPAYSFPARPALTALEEELSPDEIAAARDAAESAELEQLGEAALAARAS